MFEKEIDTSTPIHRLLEKRWSGRAYDPDKIVDQNILQSLFEAARWAPSCYGDEPWRYIVCNKLTNMSAWQQAYDCLSEGNQTWAKDAQILILGVADTILSKTGKPNRWGEFDTGSATMSLCVQATEHNLMVHQMGGYDPDKARKIFNIPNQFTPMSMIAIGYQLPLDQMSGEQKERELTPRQRSPITEKFFDGEWSSPITV